MAGGKAAKGQRHMYERPAVAEASRQVRSNIHGLEQHRVSLIYLTMKCADTQANTDTTCQVRLSPLLSIFRTEGSFIVYRNACVRLLRLTGKLMADLQRTCREGSLPI